MPTIAGKRKNRLAEFRPGLLFPGVEKPRCGFLLGPPSDGGGRVRVRRRRARRGKKNLKGACVPGQKGEDCRALKKKKPRGFVVCKACSQKGFRRPGGGIEREGTKVARGWPSLARRGQKTG